MRKWQIKTALLSLGLALVATGTAALADNSTSTGLEITGTPVTLQTAAGAADLEFKSVRLAELAQGAVDRTVELPKGTFTVTNYTGMAQTWTLVAGITNFQQMLGGQPFDGHMKFGEKELHTTTDGSLVGAVPIAQGKMDFNQYTWESDPMTVTLTVPPTVSIGTYNATIHYELQNGVVSK